MNKTWKLITFSFIVAITVITVFGCSKVEVDIIKGDNGKDGANGHSLVSQFIDANELECSTGGTRLDIYIDLNDDLSLNEEDLYQGSLVACNGSNGLNGTNGLQGVQGETGATGAQGIQGERGPRGHVGPRGERGPRGHRGEDGEDGNDGAQGVAGPVGPQGPQGPAGSQGIQGLQGATGAQGPVGPTGPSGSGATILASTSSCVLITGNYYLKNNTLYEEDDSSLCDGNHDKVSMNSSGDSLWLSASKLLIKDSEGIMRVITFN